MPVLDVDSLVKVYKQNGDPLRAVDDVSFTIEKGEIYSLLGPNGAGKSTTIGMISGLLEPTEGHARVGGYAITEQPLKAKALLGVVPQEIALYPKLTARQNLAFFGRMYGMGGDALNTRIDEVLAFIGLEDRQNDKVETFSGGMKRRVNIGVGLLHKPTLIYMDEPTVGVDPQSRRRILDTVLRLRDEYGMAVLYTTHLMEEAQELSDTVGIIDHGKLIAEGSVGELVEQIGEEDRLVLKVDQEQVADDVLERIRALEGVGEVITEQQEGVDPTTAINVMTRRGRSALPKLIEIVDDAGMKVSSIDVREPDLEAVFLHLTGRALRD
jgi:ABC-2 type transport system ATP-binding protein